jgi:hypothetical protein
MKRQRREWEAEARRNGEHVPKATTIQTTIKAPKKKELNVREALKKQRERDNQRANAEGSEDEPLPPHDPEDREPANLVAIEHIELPVRKRPSRTGNNPEDDPRWEARWNGLKNFKKFKPQEKGSVRKSNHSTKVLVPLVAMPKKTGGFGQQYWDKSDDERERDRRRKKQKEKRRAQESLSQNQSHAADEADDRSRIDLEGAEETENDAASGAESNAEESQPVRGSVRSTSERTNGTHSQPTRSNKRQATTQGNAFSNKRQKTLPVTQVAASDESDNDSDDTKFRFGKGRGRRGKARS